MNHLEVLSREPEKIVVAQNALYHWACLGYDGDFYKMPKDIFAPAQVIVNDMLTGQMYHTGFIDLERLKKSFEVIEIINKK